MKGLALSLIRFYQRHVSPMRPPACRFQPTCSQYAYDAIDGRGFFVGSGMAFWRVLRCNPLNDGGYEPVEAGRPPVFHVKRSIRR